MYNDKMIINSLVIIRYLFWLGFVDSCNGCLTFNVLPLSSFSLIASKPFNDFTLIVLLCVFCFLGGIINSTSLLKNRILHINIQSYV